MRKYINVDVARRIIDSPRSKEQMLMVLSQAEPADVVNVVHGEWVKDEEKSKKLIESIYICSACHNFEAWGETEKYNYCPNCGAKMDLKEVEDEQIH